MSKGTRTKACEFSKEARAEIRERDGGCIFCQIGYKMPKFTLPATDMMHIVGRAHGGLGIAKNGVLGCRYHHMMLDNGNGGERAAMMEYIENYMTRLYPGWNKDELIYRKDWN